jgi:hypothetical protein
MFYGTEGVLLIMQHDSLIWSLFSSTWYESTIFLRCPLNAPDKENQTITD